MIMYDNGMKPHQHFFRNGCIFREGKDSGAQDGKQAPRRIGTSISQRTKRIVLGMGDGSGIPPRTIKLCGPYTANTTSLKAEDLPQGLRGLLVWGHAYNNLVNVNTGSRHLAH